MASTKTFPSNALIPSSLHFSPAPTLNARLHARDSFSTGVHAFLDVSPPVLLLTVHSQEKNCRFSSLTHVVL
jgi:hypothetical protein